MLHPAKNLHRQLLIAPLAKKRTAPFPEAVRCFFIRNALTDQPLAAEREIPFAGDDYVVQQTDVEQLRGTCDPLGQRLVLPARLGSARRMVVNQNQLRGEQFQTPV